MILKTVYTVHFTMQIRAILLNKLKNYVVTIELILAGDENLTPNQNIEIFSAVYSFISALTNILAYSLQSMLFFVVFVCLKPFFFISFFLSLCFEHFISSYFSLYLLYY
jgi:hypothetical protein